MKKEKIGQFNFMSLDKLEKDISLKKLKPVYLFYGEEDFLVEQALNIVKAAALEPGADDFNLDVFYGSETDGAKIVNTALSYPMMAERRLVIVKDIHELKVRDVGLLEKYCKKPSITTCLILTATKVDMRKKGYSGIKKQSYTLEFKALYDDKVPDWIHTLCRRKGLEITPNALQLLHLSAGNKLRVIDTELEKLKLLLGDQKQIHTSDVEQVVGISKKYNIFELCNAVGERNLDKALNILARMLELGEPPTVMLYMLARHFSLLLKIKELAQKRAPRTDIARQVGINQFFIGGYLQQQNNFQPNELYFAIEKLLDADKKLKTSYQKPKMILELLLVQIVQKATR